ncbi:MAG TPA: hypothetical protein VMR34_00930 [Candidatus Saccharimonadales bacterium]|nr:hypothetical protein [Candidatus Saccharimonadales bacterium]
MQSSKNRLRPPGDILRVVETYTEARRLLEPLAEREIGGICLKGAVTGVHSQYWAPDSELRKFAYQATSVTRGFLTNDFELLLRRQPRGNLAKAIGGVTVFKGDSEMHFDGFFTETFDESGVSTVNTKTPLIGEVFYEGVSHHITKSGTTTFVMERLSDHRVRKLARNQERKDLGVTDTNPLNMAVQGEAVELESGDYVALHSYAVHRKPVYAHGSVNSSEDRRSVTYNPFESYTVGFIDLDRVELEAVDDPELIEAIKNMPNY